MRLVWVHGLLAAMEQHMCQLTEEEPHDGRHCSSAKLLSMSSGTSLWTVSCRGGDGICTPDDSRRCSIELLCWSVLTASTCACKLLLRALVMSC
jgi:hypothetical protein